VTKNHPRSDQIRRKKKLKKSFEKKEKVATLDWSRESKARCQRRSGREVGKYQVEEIKRKENISLKKKGV